jgi:hypothetical protein
MTDSKKKSASELLAELNRVRALLATRAPAKKDDDIPLLDDVVGTDAEPEPATLAGGGEEVAAAPDTTAAPAPGPIPDAAPLPSEEELQGLIDQIIDREMPRIRLELKRVLRDELRMRDLLK